VGRGEHAIVLDHGAYYTTYSHNRVAFVAPGDVVTRGEIIAEVGTEGYSGGPHLHFEQIDKALAPWTGDWRRPFEGCAGYVDPGLAFAP
jgi:murein DD-endopeptidase MepM/ murein hydrolase activator NlpD